MVDSLLNYVPDFAVNWIKVRTVQWSQIWKFVRWPRSLKLLHFRSRGSKWCTEC